MLTKCVSPEIDKSNFTEFDFMIRQFCQTSFILWNLLASSLLIADTNTESVLPDLGSFSVNKQQEDQLGQYFFA